MTKIGTVTVVRNAAIMVAIVPSCHGTAVVATVVCSALSLLPAALLRLLGVLAALCLLWRCC